MDDALARVVHAEDRHAELGAVLLQSLDLDAALFVLDALGTVGGRHVVVRHRQGRLGMAQLAAGEAEPFEGLGRGHLMDERSEEHTSELQSLMRISYAVFCLKKKKKKNTRKEEY